jgi:hypothetical protein
MRDAESTLDQLISFCGDKIEEADVLSMFGLAAQGQILELSRAVLAGEIQTAQYEFRVRRRDGKLVEVEAHGAGTLVNGRPAIIGMGKKAIYATGRGTIKLTDSTGNTIQISNVLHVPGSIVSLLSVSALAKQGFRFQFSPDSRTISFSKNHFSIDAPINPSNDLYISPEKKRIRPGSLKIGISLLGMHHHRH